MADDTQTEVLLDRLAALAGDRESRDGRDSSAHHRDKEAHVDTLRLVCSKLHARATSQDKLCKDRTMALVCARRPSLISDIVTLIESTRDPVCLASLVGILKESVACEARGQRVAAISQLVGCNSATASALLRVLASLSAKEVHAAESLVADLVWLLYRIAFRDGKFAGKVRSAGACKVLHVVLRTQASGGKHLLSALHIFQIITKNQAVCAALARDGVAPTLEKLLSATGVLPSPRLRLILMVVANLCRTRSFLSRLCRGPLLCLLLRPMSRWDNFSGRVRLRICQCTLVALQYAVAFKAGRKALVSGSGGGAGVLQRFCRLCPEDRAYDAMVSRVCGILQQLGERRGLPVQGWVGPATFQFTPSDQPEEADGDCSDYSGDEGDDVDEVDEDDEDADVEAEADDDDPNRQEKPLPGTTVSSQRSSQRGSLNDLLDTPLRRDHQDLAMYAPYCRELLGGQVRETSASVIGDHNAIPSCSELSVLQGVGATLPPRRAYCAIASRVRTVTRACKVAYPDMVGGSCTGQLQPLSARDRRVCRAKLLQCVDRALQPGQLWNIVAYDLDRLMVEQNRATEGKTLKNDDESRLGARQMPSNSLRFESRFESGNLRKAIQIGPREYDLILSSDVNSTKHHQWFYFEVSNMDGEAPYVFNIINNEKANSQFNFGMQPVVYSVREATLGRPGWTHMGSDICYYRNSYLRPDGRRGRQGRLFHTTTFSIKFPHSLDVCYVAYHYPYTYTQLLMQVLRWSQHAEHSTDDAVLRVEALCRTLGGNEVPVLTITAKDSKQNPIQGRSLVFLTARVHPGESNSSHVIQGTLDALLAPTALGRALRAAHVVKVVPMLNVEGVVNGCHRCGLTNDDLNRKWSKPDPKLHPSIYHTKGLLEYLTRVLQRPPFVFIDFHGHSRKKNVFLYGCSRAESWSTTDRSQPDNPAEYAVLPQLLSLVAPAFSLSSCCFRVERGREATARVTVWRELGVGRAYTVEASYCGCDQGPYQGYQLSSAHLREMGANLCQALVGLPEETERQRSLSLSSDGTVPVNITSMTTISMGMTGTPVLAVKSGPLPLPMPRVPATAS